MSETAQNDPSTDTPKQIKFEIQRFYVKEQSCKLPQGVNFPEGKPENKLELNINSQQVQPDIFEVTLTLHVTQTINQRTTLVMEVQQAGLFKLEKTDEKALAYLLNVYCPNLLYPYACKVVSGLSMDAGLPPVFLMPMNFEQMYRQQKEKADEGARKKEVQEATVAH